MKLLDYIRGLRKGKEAHRLERESMQDPFLADAIDGYSLVEGNHEQRIEKLRMQVSTHSAKKKKARAITWSIAACLVIGFGISSYFLFLKKSMTDEVFIAEESAPAKLPEATTPATPTNPATPAASVTPRKEIALAATKVKTDSAPISEIAMKQAGKKDMIAQIQTTSQPQGTSVATVPVMEGNIIQGKVTDEKGEPIIGASVAYKGTNIGTTTNTNGEFSLVKKKGEKRLTAQFIGYDPVEVPVDTSQTILIAMNENKQALNEVVVVGYGTKKEITPQPVIGKRKYQKYLKKNLIRPTDDSCKDIKGKIVLSFFVDQEGTPQNITVIHGLCESADKEAIRLVKEGPKWTIGKNPARITVRF